MKIRVLENREQLGSEAARQAAGAILRAIRDNGLARVIAACAPSQLEFLESLVPYQQIDWALVELFHLDEYLGIPMDHPASFCRFLQERLIGKTGITNHH